MMWSHKAAQAAPAEAHSDVMFDYDAAAELYFGHAGGPARRKIGYRRFAQAAAALQFAVEELEPAAFSGAYLEIDDDRYNGEQIRLLYAHARFPLARPASVRSRLQR